MSYVQTIPKKGMKQVREDLTNICLSEGIEPKSVLIFLEVGGLSYTLGTLIGKIYLSDNPMNQKTRKMLQILDICADSHPTLFELNDRFNETNNLKDKFELASRICKELKALAPKLDPFMENEVLMVSMQEGSQNERENQLQLKR